MTHLASPRALTAALALPLLAAPPVTELTFVPEEGRTVALLYRESASAEVVDEAWVPIHDGVRSEVDGGSSDGGATWAFEIEGVLVDVYDAVEDGRVTALTRSFEEFEGASVTTIELDDGVEELETALAMPLQDRTLTFAWDGDAEEYDVAFDEEGDDDEVDEILLGGMRIDAFGAWFLPPDGGAVEEGDSWDAGVDAWNDCLEFGGNFWIDVEENGPPDAEQAEYETDLARQMRDTSDGEVVCTFEGMDEVDGVEVAVISIAVEISCGSEGERTDSFDDEEVTTVETIDMEYEGEGTCLWLVDEHRPLSITFELEARDTTVSTDTVEGDGETYAIETTVVTDTKSSIEYRFEER